ncbi:basic amino acid ABC transporter substrate-binding protein [Agathobaculum sp. NSJ-28]|uniref:Basic amino acid ABC transporter substrate-binding protein n=2 Tax=Agathobaculum TaxID=2048137 RepID=A0A923RUK4_9FIRM|nr:MULTISPECIES: basic amino acid ABC transporter substrate-binding protein [Butyricicoccaceae]MBS6882108.1 basic amino acid ABC transporter substrate-binding protein [Clostridiaceae bacterium]SCI42005.1 ABC transporter arginine-binding protein 1 precursor [uncultured Butyricicoccus sp.]MBC5724032.1 basic amino acid ABC transporter substrate-binding protein [Agathobaculum faecis]MCU6787665.1 basic amino acid ABC transporter substrate-binding protein [Agathobaculum ammoniilyticum]WOC74020.1 bas
MKKFSIAMLSMVLAGSLLLSGCGGNTDTQQNEDSNTDAAATDSTDTADGGVLRMGTNATFPPYEFTDENGEVAGIDAEIAAAVAEKLGMELDITDMAFESLIPALQAGTIDIVLAGMTVDPERADQVNFTDSYATGVQVVIVPENSDIAPVEQEDGSLAVDLTGKTIGVQTGTTGDLYCTDDYGQENVKQFDNGPLAVAALVNGQIDCVVIDQEPAKNYVAANEGLKILDTAYANEDYAAAISKDNTELLEQVNAAMQELKDDGTLQSIIDKYITADGE